MCSRNDIHERCALRLSISTPVDCTLNAHAGALLDESLGRRPSSSTDPRAKHPSAICGRRLLNVEATPAQAPIAEISIWTSHGNLTREREILEKYRHFASQTFRSHTTVASDMCTTPPLRIRQFNREPSRLSPCPRPCR